MILIQFVMSANQVDQKRTVRAVVSVYMAGVEETKPKNV